MANVSSAMQKHYRSMFRKYKARVRAIQNEGLNLDIVNTTMSELEYIGIDPMQKSLSLDDIVKLSKGSVLDDFLSNKLSTAKGRVKVYKTIASKVSQKYDELDAGAISTFSNFLTTSSYAVAVSLGILSSDIVADILDNLDDGVEDIELESAVDETVNEFLRGEIKQKNVYQTIMDKLALL